MKGQPTSLPLHVQHARARKRALLAAVEALSCSVMTLHRARMATAVDQKLAREVNDLHAATVQLTLKIGAIADKIQMDPKRKR
jgi:hypothetical protein